MELTVKPCSTGRAPRTPHSHSCHQRTGNNWLTWFQAPWSGLLTFKQLKCWVCVHKEEGVRGVVSQIQDPLTSSHVRWFKMRHERRRRPTRSYAVAQRPNTLRPRYSTLVECWCLAVRQLGCGPVMLFTVGQTRRTESGKTAKNSVDSDFQHFFFFIR